MQIGDQEWIRTILEGASEFGVILSENQTDLMALHCMELVAWNKITNLTSITDPAEIAVKHVIDSLAASEMIEQGSRVVDIGTGGGFPGIPLKIARDDIDMLLLDSSRKRVSFLKQVIIKSKIKDIRAIHSRAEDIAHTKGIHKTFDVAISRAFSSLGNIFALSAPFLNSKGFILSMKGREAKNEMESFVNEHGTEASVSIREYDLPMIRQERAIIKIVPVTNKA